MKLNTYVRTVTGMAITLCAVFFFVGCDEGINIFQGVTKEPKTAEQKQPEEPEEPAETVPADTEPPTVVEVAWYHDQQLKQLITDDIHPETVYAVVTFSEAVQHSIADDKTARPVLFIVINDTAPRLPIAETLDTNSAKRIGKNGDRFVCRIKIPEDAAGTIALRIGSATADLAGNAIGKALVHDAPFMITEKFTIIPPKGFSLPSKLIPTEPTVLTEDERAMLENAERNDWDVTAVNTYTTKSAADTISVLPIKDREEVYALFIKSVDLPFFARAAEKLKERNITLGKLNKKGETTGDWKPYDTFFEKSNRELGITEWGVWNDLTNIYFEENPRNERHRKNCSRYWMILEWYRLQLVHRRLQTFVDTPDPRSLLRYFTQSCGRGYVFGTDNPWN